MLAYQAFDVSCPPDCESTNITPQQQPKRQCPISASCSVPHGISLAAHLKKTHKAAECNAVVDADGSSTVQMDSTILFNMRATRRSVLLLNFPGAVFLWSLESFLRADTETQASVTLQLLESKPSPPTTPSPRRIVDCDGWFLEDSTAMPSSAALSSSCYEISISSSKHVTYCNGKSSQIEWKGEVSSDQALHRHDQLVSHGRAFVALWPTHNELFEEIPDKEDASKLTVITRIKRV